MSVHRDRLRCECKDLRIVRVDESSYPMHIVLTEDLHARETMHTVSRRRGGGNRYARVAYTAGAGWIGAGHRPVDPKVVRIAIHIHHGLSEKQRPCPNKAHEVGVAGLCVAESALDEPFERIRLGGYQDSFDAVGRVCRDIKRLVQPEAVRGIASRILVFVESTRIRDGGSARHQALVNLLVVVIAAWHVDTDEQYLGCGPHDVLRVSGLPCQRDWFSSQTKVRGVERGS